MREGFVLEILWIIISDDSGSSLPELARCTMSLDVAIGTEVTHEFYESASVLDLTGESIIFVADSERLSHDFSFFIDRHIFDPIHTGLE